MKLLKKNQIIIYVIVLMLMTAGYLNYTTNTEKQVSIETSMQMESKDDMELADIGDATLVNSNDVVTENVTNTTNSVGEDEESNSNPETDSMVKEKETIPTNSSNKNEYFVTSKLERDTMYSQMVEAYEKVLNSSNSLEVQKQSASQEIQKINETKNSIMICENLIKTKGFENNIIFVNGESISVIIGTQELQPNEVAQIQNIISREMKAKVENIHIAAKEQ